MVNETIDVPISKEEKEFRRENYKDVFDILNMKPVCTSCQAPVTELIAHGIPQIHPILKTLFCWQCSHFYGDGKFSEDEEGGEKYCKWCGQGGTLYLCSSCPAGFCKKCIRRNLPRSVLTQVDEDDWKCFCCNVEPLYDLRAQGWAAQKYAATIKKEDREATKQKKAEKADKNYGPSPRKSNKKVELSAQEKTLSQACRKYSEYLGSIETMCESVKKACGELRSDKLNRRAVELYTGDSINALHSKVIKILNNTQQTSQDITEKCEKYLDQLLVSLDAAKKQDEEDEKNKKENLEAGTSKRKVKKTDENSDHGSDDESAKKNRKDENSDDGSEYEKIKKSRRSGKDSGDESEKETTPLKKRFKFRKASKSDESEEDDSRNNKKRTQSFKKSRNVKDSDSETETLSSKRNGKAKKRVRKSKKTQDSDLSDD